MTTNVLFESPQLCVVDYQCTAGLGDAPFVERHGGFSVAYVRKGSFGYRAGGRSAELVAGSLLVGTPGAEYVRTHDHACGDECLSFQFAENVADMVGAGSAACRTGGNPPLPELMVTGELAQAAADGRSDIGLDEVGLALAARYIAVACGHPRRAT